MLKRFSIILALAFAGGALLSAQSTVHLTINRTNPADGKQMFVNYCAPCHGVDGRGNGPVASELKTAPSDLTMIATNNRGVYPAVHLMAVVKFGVQVPAHGSQEMPIWGSVLGQIDQLNNNSQQERVSLRIYNLVQYLKTLQTK
jgi:mono/diheme cytochrome c family protein